MKKPFGTKPKNMKNYNTKLYPNVCKIDPKMMLNGIQKPTNRALKMISKLCKMDSKGHPVEDSKYAYGKNVDFECQSPTSNVIIKNRFLLII